MKLRSRPEDFIVEEDCALSVTPKGPYGLYRLRKRGLTTPEAVRRIARAGKIDTGRIRFCGLKDRHAITVQTLTVFGKPVGALRGQGFELRPLGRTQRQARSTEIEGNQFWIVVRDLSRDEAEAARARAASYARTGIPNYFDDQRFGSARSTGAFPGEHLCRGDAEEALRLIIATWSREDSPDVKKNRRAIAASWGDWTTAKQKLTKSTERSIVTYLTDHPHDFVGAFDRLPESLRGIVLSAFQSLIWNETLSRIVGERVDAVWVHEGRYDDVTFFEPTGESAEALAGLVIPMAHRSWKARDESVAAAVSETLEARGLTSASFKLRGFKKTYFWRGERRALAKVGRFECREPFEDELNEGRFAIKLRFSLPPGVYATMFVKAALGPGGSTPGRRTRGT